MAAEQNQKIQKKGKLNVYITPISAISENTRVQLDASKSYYLLPVNSTESTVFINENKDGISYSWEQIGGPPVTFLEDANKATPSFLSPYVDINNKDNDKDPKIYTTLKFRLTVKDKYGNSEKREESVIVKRVQRALILQGGGALGAYEVGVVKALIDNLTNGRKKSSSSDGNYYSNNRPLFDIVGGTSIGAVNASILVGNVIKLQEENPNLNQSEIWKNAIEKLERFWDEISDPFTLIPEWIKDTPLFEKGLTNWNIISQFNSSLFDSWWHFIRGNREVWNKYYEYLSKEAKHTSDNIGKVPGLEHSSNIDGFSYFYIPVITYELPYFKWVSLNENWKEELPYIQNYFLWPENWGPVATVEALRRYLSVAGSLLFGAPKALTSLILQPDSKFFGLPFARFDNTPLLRTIKKYWDYDKYPIKTSFKDHEPRLLLISVDALDATSPVAFDSYYDDNKYDKENGICKSVYGDEEYQHIIEYKDGIRGEHVMASMSVHFKHKYPSMKVKSKFGGETEEPELKDRSFWDGAYLSNTPLREVLYGHRHYWRDLKNIQEPLENRINEIIVPDMEVYIINLYPAIENELPNDADTIQDRETDIKVHGKTKEDIRLAEIATDYIEFIEKLESHAFKHSEDDPSFKKEYEALLNDPTRTTPRFRMKPRTYKDIVKGRFDITKVVCIERSDDGSTIFGKAGDFSSKTVKQLMETGYEEAQTAIEIESIRKIINDLASKEKEGIVNHFILKKFEEKFEKAILHAKHQNICKTIEELNILINYEKDIKTITTAATNNVKEKHFVDEAILQLSKSISKLEIQLMINRITVIVNRDIITENQGDNLKQRLQQIKKAINADQPFLKDKNVIENELCNNLLPR